MAKNKAVILFLFSVVIACSPANKLSRYILKLEGTWQLENTSIFEVWEIDEDILSGHVIKIENTDTLIVENLRIVKQEKECFYEATVPDQNLGTTIRFKLTQRSNHLFQFENPEHDFPQKIIYNFIDDNTLKATISNNNKQRTFNYQKISHK